MADPPATAGDSDKVASRTPADPSLSSFLFSLAVNGIEGAGGMFSHAGQRLGQSWRPPGIELIGRSVFQFYRLAFVILTLAAKQQRNEHTFESEQHQKTQYRESKNLPYIKTQFSLHNVHQDRNSDQTEDKQQDHRWHEHPGFHFG